MMSDYENTFDEDFEKDVFDTEDDAPEGAIVQRRLRFRAWDPEAKEMIDEWIISQDYNYAVPEARVDLFQLAQVRHLHVMQFSGFYDRKGEEIYEGDILLSREEDTGLEEEQFEMVFEKGAYCLTDFPRGHSETGHVFYRNWFYPAGGRDLPDSACAFDRVGHIYEPLERIEQRIMALHQQEQEQGQK